MLVEASHLDLENVTKIIPCSLHDHGIIVILNNITYFVAIFFSSSTSVSCKYGTRQKDTKTVVLPKVNTEQGKRSMTFCGSIMWNSLPEDVKCKPSVNSFQKALKNCSY